MSELFSLARIRAQHSTEITQKQLKDLPITDDDLVVPLSETEW